LSGKVGGFWFESLFYYYVLVLIFELEKWKLRCSCGLSVGLKRTVLGSIHVWNMPRVPYAIMKIWDTILQASIPFDMRSHTCRYISCYVHRFHWTTGLVLNNPHSTKKKQPLSLLLRILHAPFSFQFSHLFCMLKIK
jgi:hypothetical protein